MMNSTKFKVLTFFGLLVSGAVNTTIAAEDNTCDIDRPIVFAGFDWDSARLHNSVARFILENGYGCETDEIPGTTIPLLNGMARGDIDVSMEIWKQSVDEVWNEYVDDGSVIEIGTNFDDAVQGIFIPKWLVEGEDAQAPDLTSVSQLGDYKALFADKEEPEKGRFYNCVLGWSCAEINTKKLAAYGIEDDFVDFRPGAGAAVSSAVETAMLRHKPIVFYYWTPSWLIGRFGDELVMLDEPAFERGIWDELLNNDHPEQATAYPLENVLIGTNAEFSKASPLVSDFLSNYHTSSDDISLVLDYMRENNTDADESAAYFLTTFPQVWQQWVPAEVAEKVNSALSL